MEETQPQKSSGYRGEKRRTSSYQTPYFLKSEDSNDMMFESVEVLDGQASSKASLKSIIIYYTLLFLKAGLWILFAWILSHLHLGAPCFLLPLIAWLYSVSMRRALIWAKRRFAAEKELKSSSAFQ